MTSMSALDKPITYPIPIKPPRRYLIHDEVESFVINKEMDSSDCRIRIFRGTYKDCDGEIVEATPVVLVNRKAGDPGSACERVANYIMESLLAYPTQGALFFEVSIAPDRSRILQQVMYSYFGHGSRLRLYEPRFRVTTREHLEWIVGEPVTL